MGKETKIEWCHHTLNLWWGCQKVHAGCINCYAKVLANRWGHDLWSKGSMRLSIYSWEEQLNKFRKSAQEANEMRRVFVGSMMDIFEKPMPLMNRKGEVLEETTGELRSKLFSYVEHYPNLMFLFLTKRPSNINKYIPESWKINPPENVMFGTSPVGQETADKLIPQLLEVKGKKFLSCEPLLAEVNLKRYLSQLNWIIVGGESGHGKRPFNPDWARIIRDDCAKTGVPFFMKQWDKVREIPDDLMIREFPKTENQQCINSKIETMKSENTNNTMITQLSPFKKIIAEALLKGEEPTSLAIRLAKERKIPQASAQAYITMVTKFLAAKTKVETPAMKVVLKSNSESSELKIKTVEAKIVCVEKSLAKMIDKVNEGSEGMDYETSKSIIEGFEVELERFLGELNQLKNKKK